jgi:hypothetical protein
MLHTVVAGRGFSFSLYLLSFRAITVNSCLIVCNVIFFVNISLVYAHSSKQGAAEEPFVSALVSAVVEHTG